MTTRAGFYSVIQFRPNEVREEGINVGVIVGSDSSSAPVVVRFSKSNERAKRTFGAPAFDDDRLSSAKRALARRLTAIPLSSQGLREFIGKEAGQLVILPPRPIVLHDVDIDTDALFRELVGEELEPRRRKRTPAPNLERAFRKLSPKVPVQRDVEVTVPIIGRTLHADYAYKNGSLNLIKSEGFAADPKRATTNALKLGAQGLMLANHPLADGQNRQLIVVTGFEDPKVAADVTTILKDHSVRVFPIDKVDDLLAEVEREAHE